MNQNDIVLNHLRSGRTINALQSLKEYGIMRLASRISDIRKENIGIPIDVKMEKNELTGKHYAQYKLITSEKQLVFV